MVGWVSDNLDGVSQLKKSFQWAGGVCVCKSRETVKACVRLYVWRCTVILWGTDHIGCIFQATCISIYVSDSFFLFFFGLHKMSKKIVVLAFSGLRGVYSTCHLSSGAWLSKPIVLHRNRELRLTCPSQHVVGGSNSECPHHLWTTEPLQSRDRLIHIVRFLFPSSIKIMQYFAFCIVYTVSSFCMFYLFHGYLFTYSIILQEEFVLLSLLVSSL